MTTVNAPIAVFVYNRPSHTARLLASLKANPLAQHSRVFVFCDGPKSRMDDETVQKTRAIVKQSLPSATLVESDQNLGLARSIISGVTQCVDEFGRVIVLEDDLVISPTLIEFFNQALEIYENTERVAHISGYMFPVQRLLPELFFYHEMSCWGWATWKRAWDDFQPDADLLLAQLRSRHLEFHFDTQGTIDFTGMLEKQCRGQIDSWAIRWYATNCLLGRLALHPSRSLVANEGFDGSGVHSGTSGERFEVAVHATKFSRFPKQIEACPAALAAMIEYRGGQVSRGSRLTRILSRFLRRVHTRLQ